MPFWAQRAAAQMISYEVSIGRIIISVVLFVGSLNLMEVIIFQNKIWFMIFTCVVNTCTVHVLVCYSPSWRQACMDPEQLRQTCMALASLQSLVGVACVLKYVCIVYGEALCIGT